MTGAETLDRRSFLKAAGGAAAVASAAFLATPVNAKEDLFRPLTVRVNKVIDLTHPLTTDFPTFGGQPQLAIKNVFKDRAYEIPVSSNKSMLGHLIASAAAIELIMSVMTINEQLIPPTINYEHPDPECDLDYVPNEPRCKRVETILSNSFAFGGQNASVLVKKYQ